MNKYLFRFNLATKLIKKHEITNDYIKKSKNYM
jgi:hypothetical protein